MHRFHRLTCYAAGRHWLVPADDPAVRQDFLPMDEARRPRDDKAYPAGLDRVTLPADPPASSMAGADALCGVVARGSPKLDISELSRLLHWSAGVVRERLDGPSGRVLRFRAAGSAGNLHPVELYLHTSRTAGVPDGVWHYRAAAHELIRIGPSAFDGVGIVLSGVPWRSEWRYAERGYRHLWWDLGAIVAHLDLLTRASSRRALVRLVFPDAVVASVVGADGHAELPLALLSLDADISELRPRGTAALGDLGPPGPRFPLVEQAHQAGVQDSWGEAGVTMPGAEPVPSSADVIQVPAEELIRRRAATRRFRPEAVDPAALDWPMTVASRPIDGDSAHVPVALDVFVHRVAGLAPGHYRLSAGSLERMFAGDMRADAVAACLRQQAAGDCAYLLLLTADLDAQLRTHGQRGYRALQTCAGVAASRVQLAATALGLGSIPLTICDEIAGRFVPAGTVPLLAVAVGHPLSNSVSGGPPRAPVRLNG